MSDLISRQDVIDRINKQREHLSPYLYPQDKIGDSAYRICTEFVERLPSAEPRKKGKWIDYSEDGFVECPFCHSATNCEGNEDELHYCFCCGADMRGEQE